MSKKLNSRLDHFLGIVAGRKDADISTLTPPVPTNPTEELLVDIAKRIGNGSAAAEPYYITISYDNETYSCDRTLSDIEAAIDTKQDIRFISNCNTGGFVIEREVGYSITFGSIDTNNGGAAPGLALFTIFDNGVVCGRYEILNNALMPVVSVREGATQNIYAADNYIYKCGEVTSLTVLTQSGIWTLIFTSGTTPTTLTMPASVHMPDGFFVEANRRYEISIDDGYAVVSSWEAS